MIRKRKIEQRKVSLVSAVISVITALVIEYLLLEGSVMASTHKYFSSHAFSSTIDYKKLQYTIDDYTLNIELPAATEIQVSPDKGEEMQFSIYFVNNDLAFRGYIQLWRIKDLENFLSNSKTLSPFDFISYNMSSLQHNFHRGFKTEWSADFGETFISGKEYWWSINSNEEVIRVSFYTDTAGFPAELDPVIQHILNSIELDSNLAHTPW